VDDVGKRSRSKIEAEHVNLSCDRFLHECNDPLDHVVVHVGGDHGLLNRGFLEDRQAESLGDRSILLFL
jgi:hypothetical protein